MSTPVIKANNLTKIYKLFAEEIYAVNNIDLEIRCGEFVSLMGPSGSGKTTLLDLMGCLDSVSCGRLEVLGNEVSCARENDLVKYRRGIISFIFQEFLLIPSLTALENVELSLHFSRMTKERKHSLEIMERVGLGHRINHLPKQLSGGERQRVAIARALAVSPQLLLADEPTGNLDTKSAQEIFSIFKKLNEEDGLTIIVATHNPKLGLQASRTIFLQDGKIISKEKSSLFLEMI
ncbi:MAG: ABC transporter ATP-binding protein [Candidatus Omnitrophica bacterium]|nr:ABC transporter ATP-binding protein [Candidatus Omnitrophota bacterium]